MNKASEFKKMSYEELQAELISLRKQQLNYRLQKANGSLEKTHLVNNVKKSIAQVKTIMTEKAGN